MYLDPIQSPILPIHIFLPSLCSYSISFSLSFLNLMFTEISVVCVYRFYSVTYSHQVAQPGLERILDLNRPWRWHLPTSAYWTAEITFLYHRISITFLGVLNMKKLKSILIELIKIHILWLILNPIGTFFHCFRIWYYTSLDFLYF